MRTDGTLLEGYFTDQELQLLQLFLERNNEIVDYDAIANVLWKDITDEKFSLYAIAKVVENIRKKLHNLGIHRELIHTIRKRGYLFAD